MKFVLLNDRDEGTTDGVFYVPDDADIRSFVEKCNAVHLIFVDNDRIYLEHVVGERHLAVGGRQGVTSFAEAAAHAYRCALGRRLVKHGIPLDIIAGLEAAKIK